jgi:hypothetical protein
MTFMSLASLMLAAVSTAFMRLSDDSDLSCTSLADIRLFFAGLPEPTLPVTAAGRDGLGWHSAPSSSSTEFSSCWSTS